MDSIEQAVSSTEKTSASGFNFSHRKLYEAIKLSSWQWMNDKNYMHCYKNINFLIPKIA